MWIRVGAKKAFLWTVWEKHQNPIPFGWKNEFNYRYLYHKSYWLELQTNLANYASPYSLSSVSWFIYPCIHSWILMPIYIYIPWFPPVPFSPWQRMTMEPENPAFTACQEALPVPQGLDPRKFRWNPMSMTVVSPIFWWPKKRVMMFSQNLWIIII